MKIYLTDDKSVKRAVVMQYNEDSYRYTGYCKSIELSSLPEPDQTSLKLTVENIISSEKKLHNYLTYFDLFILYPMARYKGLKNGSLTVVQDANVEYMAQAAKEEETN